MGFLFPLFLPSAWAELSPQFERLRVEQGLPTNEINRIIQDRKGFLWFATNNGLARYDGYAFRLFQHDPDDPASLANNQVAVVTESRGGALWIGYWGSGISRFDPRTGTFRHFRHTPREEGSLSHDNVWEILEDRQGRLWVASQVGLDRLDEGSGRFVHIPLDGDDPPHHAPHSLTNLLEDGEGWIWATSLKDGVFRVDPESGRVIRLRHDPRDPGTIQNDGARGLYRGEDGTIWIGHVNAGIDAVTPGTLEVRHVVMGSSSSFNGFYLTAGSEVIPGELWVAGHAGLWVLNPATGQLRPSRVDPDQFNGISHRLVEQVIADREGGVWIATRNGVDHFNPRRLFFRQVAHTHVPGHTLRSNLVSALHEGDNGTIWVGSNQGVDLYHRETGRIVPFPLEWPEGRGQNPITITAILPDGAGNVWIASSVGLRKIPPGGGEVVHYGERSPPPHRLADDGNVVDVARDPHGHLWVGTRAGGLHRIDGVSGEVRTIRPPRVPGESLNWIEALMVDRTGQVWIGSQYGLYIYDPLSDTVRHFLRKPGDPTSLSTNLIKTIFQDRQGRVWLGGNQGLDRFDPQLGRVANLSRANGLPGNGVQSIQEDQEGHLWLGTVQGLVRYDPQTGAVRTFDQGNGVLGLYFNSKVAARCRDGTILMGGTNGFTLIDPRKVVASDYQPRVALSDFLLFNKPVGVGGDSPLGADIAYTDQVTLTHEQSVFSFVFSALEYSAPGRNRYAYRLEGFDREWIETDAANRAATYMNLPPGDYRFRVRSTNVDGVWSPHEVDVGVTLLPPWWRTTGFQGALLLIGIVSVVGGYQWRVGLIRRRNVELEGLVAHKTARLAESEAQMRQARDEAEQSSQAKSVFLATVTHEFRTPLNGILGIAQLLGKTVRERAIRDDLRIITDSAETLLALVNDILDFSSFDVERSRFETVAFEPWELIGGVCRLMEPRAREKGLAFQVMNRIPRDARLKSAPERIRQVLFNLMGNAIKFTHAGGVVVRADLGPHPEGGWTTLTIEVEDTGIGLSPGDQGAIFDLFGQVDPSPTRGYEGLGLGLAIVKRIVDHFGGRISLSSQPGSGACFRVEIPCPLAGSSPPAVWEPGLNRDSVPLRFLVVEDLPVNQQVAKGVLEYMGHEVEIVESGVRALQRIRQDAFDALLVDIRMPGMDGFTVVDRIRRMGDRRVAALPIYAYTANHADAAGVERYRQAGFDGVLAKPIRAANVDELVARVRERRWERGEPAGGAAGAGSGLIDGAFLAEEIAGLGWDKVKFLFSLFEETSREIMTALEAAMEEGNRQECIALAHKLASGALNVGLRRLGERARALEGQLEEGELAAVAEGWREVRDLYARSLEAVRQLLASPPLAGPHPSDPAGPARG